jgi:hypothetical protein
LVMKGLMFRHDQCHPFPTVCAPPKESNRV